MNFYNRGGHKLLRIIKREIKKNLRKSEADMDFREKLLSKQIISILL